MRSSMEVIYSTSDQDSDSGDGGDGRQGQERREVGEEKETAGEKAT